MLSSNLGILPLPERHDTSTPPRPDVDVHQTHVLGDCLHVSTLEGETEDDHEEVVPLFT